MDHDAPDIGAGAARLTEAPARDRPQPGAAGSPQRLATARAFAIEAARLAAQTKCHNVAVLDMTGVSPITDFLVLGTGTSARQMRTVVDEIAELAGQRSMSVYSRDGYEGELWMVLDLVDIVVHVFSQDARQFYDLDNLWGDGRKVDWNE